ncbi:hypothetical protein FB45DRAFT_463457, partial [Roridomyces roridus]
PVFTGAVVCTNNLIFFYLAATLVAWLGRKSAAQGRYHRSSRCPLAVHHSDQIPPSAPSVPLFRRIHRHHRFWLSVSVPPYFCRSRTTYRILSVDQIRSLIAPIWSVDAYSPTRSTSVAKDKPDRISNSIDLRCHSVLSCHSWA